MNGKTIGWWEPPANQLEATFGDIVLHLNLSIQGLRMVTTRPRVFEMLHDSDLRSENKITWEEYEERSAAHSAAGMDKPGSFDHVYIDELADNDEYIRARKEAQYIKKQRDLGFPVLHSQAVINLWGAMEHWIRGLFMEWLRYCGPELPQRIAETTRIPLSVALNPDEEARYEEIARIIENDIDARLKRGIGRFDSLLKIMGYGGGIDAEVRKRVHELSQVRHVLVHRGGLADTRFVSECDWLDVTVGDQVRVTSKDFARYIDAAAVYAAEVHKWIESKSSEPTVELERDGSDQGSEPPN